MDILIGALILAGLSIVAHKLASKVDNTTPNELAGVVVASVVGTWVASLVLPYTLTVLIGAAIFGAIGYSKRGNKRSAISGAGAYLASLVIFAIAMAVLGTIIKWALILAIIVGVVAAGYHVCTKLASGAKQA